jgi:hypothetical protein
MTVAGKGAADGPPPGGLGEGAPPSLPVRPRWLLPSACLVLAGVAALLLAEPLARLPLPVPRDFNDSSSSPPWARSACSSTSPC